MAGKLGKFQKLTFEHWKGLTKDNHLGGIFQKSPQMATNLMVQLLALYRGKTLDTFLSQFPTKTFESDDEYTWPIIGSALRNIPLVEARDCDGVVIASGGDNVGVNGEPFYLVFAEDWFADGEVIGGELNEVYPIRILGEARNEGTQYVYKVELMGGITTGMPAERLLAGERFSVDYAPVERSLSRQVGDIRFASSVAMRNEFSTIRIKHKVPGNMLGKKVAFGIPLVDPDTGKKRVENMWMHNVQWELEWQWNEYKNNLLAYGRSNRNQNGEYLNLGKSGEVIRMGAGLYEQMEVSNTDPYNTFSLKRFMDDLYQISRGKLDFGERKFLVKTGEMGAIQFSKAALSDGSGWSPITYEYSASELGAMTKTTSKMTPHGGAFKLTAPQVTEFIAPNGVYVKIDVDPFYDDPIRNKITYQGAPAMSYRYDIFDIGTMDQPNIFKVAVQGQEGDMTSYQWGLRNPFTGQMGNPNMSFDEDSAIIHKMTTTGICVLDPTRTMSYYPALLAG